MSIAQRGCWCSRAAVRWREGLIGGDLLLYQRAQHAPSPGAETCWWATGASFSVLSLALCSMSQYSCCADRRAGCVVPRVEREARGARLSVNPAAHARRQGCSTGDWHCGDAVAVTPTLLCRSKAPVLCFLAAEILACCVFLYRRLQLPSCVFLYYRRVVQVLRGGSVYSRNMCVFSYHWLRVEKERKHVLSCSCLVSIIAPSRGGGLLLGETRSAEPTLGDPCLLYGGPLPATAYPPG